MQIDVFSDVVCPWCYIGKRHLEAALKQAGIGDAQIHWRAYQLNPDIPPAGLDRRRYLEEKFGGAEAVARIHERVSAAGQGAGIGFQFDKIVRSPNTFDAHRLLRLAAAQEKQQDVAEALFHAYFIDGRDIGDHGVLIDLATAVGLSGDLAAWLAGGSESDGVRQDLAAAAQMGIGGVPFFVFANRYALSGAQPMEVFTQTLRAAAQAA